jgi:hypothetical protein
MILSAMAQSGIASNATISDVRRVNRVIKVGDVFRLPNENTVPPVDQDHPRVRGLGPSGYLPKWVGALRPMEPTQI